MKKLLFTTFAFLLSFGLFVSVASTASAAFNNDSRDLPTVTVTNDSNNPCSAGPANGCWSTSTTAQPGDLISVQIYYHNTGSATAPDVSIGMSPKNSGSKTTHTFNGGVAAYGQVVASGSATVRLSEGATLNYIPGSTTLYRNQSTNGSAVSGDTYLFSSTGLDIGDVAAGWSGQGVLVADFRVGTGTVTPPTQSYQCNDGVDNDGDGRIDYGQDPGCSSSTDNDEYNYVEPPVTYQCSDGIDNDGDGLIDYNRDPGCTSGTDNSEYNTVTPPVVDRCQIDSFTADDRTIEKGDSALLRWNTSDCNYVTLTTFSGNLDPDSTAKVHPTSDKTYTLTAYPNGGSRTVTINVDDAEEDRDECDIDTFKASRTSIERGQSVTLTWKVVGADRVEINGVSKSKNSSMSVSPYTSTTYRLEVEGDDCDDEASIRINVNEANDSRPQAITTIATIFGSTSAQLNGIAVPNTTSGSTNAWFEWGTSSSLGYRTGSKNVGGGNGSIPYSDIVSGLVPGTTYYYRAVVENQNGTAYGSIVSFRTSNSVQGTTVVQGPTRVIVQTVRDSVTAESAASLLELRVESAYDHMCVGGEMEYVVTYRNISAVTLEDTVLRIALPKELTYAGASRGNYDPIDNIVTLDIGRVQPGEQGSVTVRARVNEYAVRGNLTVMTATVVYTNPITRAQEDAIAYSLITVSDECPTVLGASVVGFGSFLPDTLLEWLLLILVILALILLGRNLYKKKEEQKQA